MFSSILGAQTVGINAAIIGIEADVSKGGMPSFSLVGLPDKAVEESRDRVHAAIKNSHLKGPKSTNYKTIISLSPADIKKEGPLFDLPIALSFLLATRQIRFNPENKLFLGELSLSGKLRPIKGTLPIIQKAKAAGFTEVFLPKQNAQEAALIDGITVYGAETLTDVILHLNEKEQDDSDPIGLPRKIKAQPRTKIEHHIREGITDFGEIKGQENAKRALQIAAAGRHNVAMYGPPGTGKTMLARCFAGILPELSFDEVLEVTGVHSISGTNEDGLVTEVPFRSPHHTASFVSLVGGGANMRPGEITLAHRGVLFLDEFPEFDRRTIEALRQPIEDRTINITRARGSVSYPANFILIAAMNPCPCGNFGAERGKKCICTPAELIRYRRKMSGPIMDRIDMWVSVGKIDPKQLQEKAQKKESEKMREKVRNTRKIQSVRFKKVNGREKYNSEMSNQDVRNKAKLSKKAGETLQKSMKTMDISARGYYRIIKTARTIADLENSELIKEAHVLEALQYRPRNAEV